MDKIAVGIDVGSTTLKVVAVRTETLEILWSRYERHETRQAEKTLEMLEALRERFPDTPRLFLTGSGSGPLRAPLGARFIQEVNAVTMAVERLHPDAGSVVELGGQDAKIIIFQEMEGQGKRSICSMNDKCASGTGATIDKCVIKVGLKQEELACLRFDKDRLHHVAAKCGVFAETDIVNLLKAAVPPEEIMSSLANAIVHQNLAVLTRGNTLRPQVILLGGPNAYLPFLVDCWRLRIPETWRERGLDYPTEVPLEELIYVPANAEFYAAFGAVCFGVAEPRQDEEFSSLDGLRDFIRDGRRERLGAHAAPPLVASRAELADFQKDYAMRPFTPPLFEPGETVRAVVGLDGGSTSSKAVLMDEEGRILFKAYRLSQGNPIADTREILAEIRDWAESAGVDLRIIGFGATGYAADVLEECLRADVNIVETVAHMISAQAVMPDVDVVCDVGGQDIKILFLRNGEIRNFKLSNQCSAGNGMLLQAMADQFGVPLSEYADVAFQAELAPRFSYGCAVFLDSDRVNFQKEGFSAPELLAGLAQVLPKNIWQYVVQAPRLAQFGRNFLLQGGTQANLAALKAQVDYIRERVPGARVMVHPHCREAGAIGTAMETLRVVEKRGDSRFIGLDAAIGLEFGSRNDESTVCRFCSNHCSRTFIDTRTPSGRSSRYISGFACEKGSVESKTALRALSTKIAETKKKYPNLVVEEGRLAFRRFYTPSPLPRSGAPVQDVRVRRGLFYRVKRREFERGFQRSTEKSRQARKTVRIGMPRVLNMYSTGPFWRAYFEVLGLDSDQIVWSSVSSEEMFARGGKYGSVDPCHPSKVVQAHIHELLFKKHVKAPLDYIYFPCITHIPTWIFPIVDTACCPIVAGSPNVIKAAFTKEVDFFRRAGIEYIDHATSFTEPNLLKKVLFETWGPRLRASEDESDFAVDEGFAALAEFDRIMQEKGKAILEEVQAQDRLAVLMIGRPYHSDPGLHHGIPDELQAQGYPILSVRSLPRDRRWLAPFFGKGEDPLDIRDVWPENYSANSAQKVWAAKFAARHPNVAILDLSSFKCGHDAPTYGLIDSIISAAGTPYAALHDLDANKPAGTIKIRTRTYAYTLARYKRRIFAKEHLPEATQVDHPWETRDSPAGC